MASKVQYLVFNSHAGWTKDGLSKEYTWTIWPAAGKELRRVGKHVEIYDPPRKRTAFSTQVLVAEGMSNALDLMGKQK